MAHLTLIKMAVSIVRLSQSVPNIVQLWTKPLQADVIFSGFYSPINKRKHRFFYLQHSNHITKILFEIYNFSTS